MFNKCYGLALSDSNNLGPYQAGAIMGLLHELNHIGLPSHQVVSGVSLGALNGYIFSQHGFGDEAGIIGQLNDFWMKIAEQNSEIVKSWGWGTIYGFFQENSLYDASNLYKFIADYFQVHDPKRHVNLGITNVLNGQYKSFKGVHSREEIIKVLQASVSFPGVFKFVEAFDSLWFTGSAIYEIDVIAPINHCKKLGYEDKDIVLDVILSGNPHLPHQAATIMNAFQVGSRSFQIMNYYERMFGVLRAQSGHPDVEFRYIIGPEREMSNKIIPI
mmetsp:Transcript_17696/g.29925  ORF Transcript_17696/g.29925 Transcript_17696/m.29925 type:complete len:273 (+) Transcript_17696:211-1029(+)